MISHVKISGNMIELSADKKVDKFSNWLSHVVNRK